jgi:hypothetical protein
LQPETRPHRIPYLRTALWSVSEAGTASRSPAPCAAARDTREPDGPPSVRWLQLTARAVHHLGHRLAPVEQTQPHWRDEAAMSRARQRPPPDHLDESHHAPKVEAVRVRLALAVAGCRTGNKVPTCGHGLMSQWFRGRVQSARAREGQRSTTDANPPRRQPPTARWRANSRSRELRGARRRLSCLEFGAVGSPAASTGRLARLRPPAEHCGRSVERCVLSRNHRVHRRRRVRGR